MRFLSRTPVRTFITYPVLVPAGSRRFNRTLRLYPQPHVPGPSNLPFRIKFDTTIVAWRRDHDAVALWFQPRVIGDEEN
jgi:hypothetical protein